MCSDCPTFRPKASCAGCDGTHYKAEMKSITDPITKKTIYLCDRCSSEKLVRQATEERGGATV